MSAEPISTRSSADRGGLQRQHPPAWLALIALPVLLALSCTFPLSVSMPIPQDAAQGFWYTATPPAIFALPTEAILAQENDPPAEANPAGPPSTPTPGIVIPTQDPANVPPLLYYTQAGDTLPVLAVRFGVSPAEITSPDPIPETRLINPNQLLLIPQRLTNTTSDRRVMPDSEVVYSPSALDFDIRNAVQQAGGYLSGYSDYLGTTGNTSGADIVARVGLENSINPRLLLALLDYQSHWVTGQPENFAQRDYPMGKIELRNKGLYNQLSWTIRQLSIGYYGWREGLLTEIVFNDGTRARLSPVLNSGTVALQYYFAQLYDAAGWVKAMHPETGFPAFYASMFGNPWVRAPSVEPLFPPDVTQPDLILPFVAGQLWSYTGGPHGAWERDGARAALDFAPGSVESGCVKSNRTTVAAAPGLVVRSGHGVVVLDLDGDGYEQTGWALLYLHVSDNGLPSHAPVGTWVNTGDSLGYPSCEGGLATGTHIHIARKYNGEWIPADGPIPFNLSGWTAKAGDQPYEGTLIRDGITVIANPLGTFATRITREKSTP